MEVGGVEVADFDVVSMKSLSLRLRTLWTVVGSRSVSLEIRVFDVRE